jgi:ParB-like chromosome segregation protein Spo0J
MTADLKFHPLSKLGGPLMEGAEFDELVADIKKNGLLKPIAVFDGKILDGRNRYRACIAAGVHLVTDDIDGWIDDPAAYVISANIHRRHLTPEQKRDLLVELVKASPEKSDRTLAKEAGTTHPTIAKARKQAEATGKALPVEKRTGADGKARKQPARKQPERKKAGRKQSVPKPLKHDDRVISPELGERVGRLAYRLIRLDINLARELADLILRRGVAERLWADLGTGIEIEGNNADPASERSL